MWLLLAFCSAALLGFYDVFKKKSLANNAVLPVLGLNTLFSSLIFLPFILVSYFHPEALQDTLFYVPSAGWEVHKFIILKSFIVLSSWTFGYFGMKHLPLTIVGPINATRPVMTLVGALLIFGERLNVYQWIGVLMAIISFFMLSRRQEYGNQDNAPIPMKRCTAFPLGPPQEHQHSSHQEKLIHIVPRLYHHIVEASHQVFIVQTTDST